MNRLHRAGIAGDITPATDTAPQRRVRMQDLASMAALLERLERLDRSPPAASPAQYREVVRCVGAMLAAVEPSPTLEALLSAAPATAELYENIKFPQAGLCRQPLALAVAAEVAAQAAIRKARRTSRAA